MITICDRAAMRKYAVLFKDQGKVVIQTFEIYIRTVVYYLHSYLITVLLLLCTIIGTVFFADYIWTYCLLGESIQIVTYVWMGPETYTWQKWPRITWYKSRWMYPSLRSVHRWMKLSNGGLKLTNYRLKKRFSVIKITDGLVKLCIYRLNFSKHRLKCIRQRLNFIRWNSLTTFGPFWITFVTSGLPYIRHAIEINSQDSN